ncbi:HAD-IIA family hydrolase [Paenibacillus sp. IITD108]|uniref:HAD-IIA family hydrolase n=1 Tax=Paenibacillus sp. IITD108 TaxID=3116649 RepID=UPI002F3EA4CC
MKGFIFDLDGTVYLGDRMISGAAETIQALRDRGDKVLFLTNKPIATRQSYVDKLVGMGVPATLSEVLNSSQLVALYLKEHLKEGEKVLVIGEEPIRKELHEHGIAIVDDNSCDVDYVVLSWDRQFHYDDLNVMYQAVVRGAKVLASNPDCTCPMEDGQIPDTGTLIAALEAATGKPVDLVVGKPSAIAAEIAMNYLGLKVEDCYMVGDRLETDVKMGNDAGMNSVLVLTGVATREMANTSIHSPKYIISSIVDVVSL